MGTAEQKRNAFGKLIGLLYKLGVTKYQHIPTVSDPYHLIHDDEVEELLAKFAPKAAAARKRLRRPSGN